MPGSTRDSGTRQHGHSEFLTPSMARWNAAHRGVKFSSMQAFSFVKEIYRGRLSVVWYAVCEATREPFVVKGYAKEYLRGRHQHNVRKEINFLMKFSNERVTGIVSLQGIFEDLENVYIVTEYCHGQDLLYQMDKSGGKIPEEDVCRKVIYPLLKVLDFLHKQGIVHRDVKAENVFFSREDNLKLGDFGLAVDLNCEVAITKVGTLDYMAPEVIQTPTSDEIRDKVLTPGMPGCYDDKVDIWSLGILAFELITGKPPFEVEDMQETLKLILRSPVEIPESMSTFCSHFIQKALSKDPDCRPSAEILLQHPWICQNVGIRALSMISSSRHHSTSSHRSRKKSLDILLESQSVNSGSQRSSGSPYKARSMSTKPASPRLEVSRDAGTMADGSAETRSGMWSSSAGPAKVYGADVIGAKEKKGGRKFKLNAKSIKNTGRLLLGRPKKVESDSEGRKLKDNGHVGERSMKERIQRLFQKKLRAQSAR